MAVLRFDIAVKTARQDRVGSLNSVGIVNDVAYPHVLR